ncbi:MAG: response regulator [Melioribacter sp.]|uniref:LytR/AlgR family response regulator transcription factor n=1 Tax=Rosettibacter primus TaxID=3111523 RepID=UPI00247BB8E5|nr:response regulator [Melioribacter sp.]
MKKVLIIEDNHDLADNIYLLLKERGYKPVVAYNGNTALRLFQHEKPDIILCDIMLSDLSGYKILSEIKKIDNIKFPIFIFLTAKSHRDEIRKGMELGADDYITKPFTYEELIKSINTQLKKRERIGISDFKTVQKEEDDKKKLNYNDYIFINDKKNPGFYAVSNIIAIKSIKDYTHLILSGNKKFLLRKPMLYWQEKLPSNKFLRIHRQTIINLDYIVKVEKASSNRLNIFLKNLNVPFQVSQRYCKKIKSLLS